MIFFDKFLSAVAFFLVFAISYGLDESFRLSSHHTMNRASNDALSSVTDLILTLCCGGYFIFKYSLFF